MDYLIAFILAGLLIAALTSVLVYTGIQPPIEENPVKIYNFSVIQNQSGLFLRNSGNTTIDKQLIKIYLGNSLLGISLEDIKPNSTYKIQIDNQVKENETVKVEIGDYYAEVKIKRISKPPPIQNETYSLPVQNQSSVQPSITPLPRNQSIVQSNITNNYTSLCGNVICGSTTKVCLDGFVAICRQTCNSTTGSCVACEPDCTGHETINTLGNFYENLTVLKLFGQKNIKETAINKITANGMDHASGVVVDRSSAPNKVYTFDTGNNRVLGFNGIGQCTNDNSKSCTIDSDCGSSSCYIDGTKPADIVFGQPDFESGACNRDNNLGINKKPAIDTLCLIGYPYITNLGEYWMRANFDVDSQGNLYIVDTWNNRILKYNQPFSADKSNGKGDTVADFVWGQDNFESNEINRGSSGYYKGSTPRPDSRSLWTSFGFGTTDHISARGVSVDPQGNIWVADTFNNRVLRFPPNSKEADLVLGQSDFTYSVWVHRQIYGDYSPNACTKGPRDAPLNATCAPILAKVSPDTGELYVLDEYGAFATRILVFKQPFTNGMSAYKVIFPKYEGTSRFGFASLGFIFNTFKQGGYANGTLWINELPQARTILIDDEGNIIKTIGVPDKYSIVTGDTAYPPQCNSGAPFEQRNIWTPDGRTLSLWTPGGSIGIDSANNIYLADEIPRRIMRYALPYEPYKINDITCLPSPNGGLFPATRPPGPHSNVIDNAFGGGAGVTVFGNQLIVAGEKLKVWNGYLNKPIGAAPDIVVGGTNRRSYISNAIDEQNRLWMFHENRIRVYQLPFLSNSDIPVKDLVELYWSDTQVQIPSAFWEGSIAIDKTNKKIYIVDEQNSRVLRVSNYNDLFDGNLNNDKLLVDMVIGQPSRTSLSCNHGSPTPVPDGLCEPSDVEFDKFGNLYVIENDYEGHGNRRITVFLSEDLKNAQGLFPNLNAKKVFLGTLTSIGPGAGITGAPGSPVSIAFNSKNEAVIGNDGYYGDAETRQVRQLWLYRDPLNKQTPDAYINLPLGASGELIFDPQDNLIVQDHTWSKVWAINLERDPIWLK
ncbi:MAG: hypothetical protein HYW24_00040 [Candidatus Aenigmarchaeota archaeon]|nr:hypothetical protein [Candidatus Aenigmarchaeota archaeon]